MLRTGSLALLGSLRSALASAFLLFFLLPCTARAHVGSPDVFYDGPIGPYPAHIAIRVPPVVPGLAGIEVRPGNGAPAEVSFRPLYAATPIKNAPPAEIAKPVRDETGLYVGDLWLMKTGAYSIEVHIGGPKGEGTVRIPVDSVATHQLAFPPYLAVALLGLGGLLRLRRLGDRPRRRGRKRSGAR